MCDVENISFGQKICFDAICKRTFVWRNIEPKIAFMEKNDKDQVWFYISDQIIHIGKSDRTASLAQV